MTVVPSRETFENLYAGKAPWDIGKPQKAFIDVADQISGSVLDAGCGTGDNALFLASRGNKVTGIDFLDEPIKRAKQKAAANGSGSASRLSSPASINFAPLFLTSSSESRFRDQFLDALRFKRFMLTFDWWKQ